MAIYCYQLATGCRKLRKQKEITALSFLLHATFLHSGTFSCISFFQTGDVHEHL
jgi:hypothetical protein